MADYTPSHIGMCVSNLARTLRFYCDGLGFESGDAYELASDRVPGLSDNLEVRRGTSLTTQVIERDGFRIELLHFHEPPATGTPAARRNQLGITHLCLSVDDVDAAAERMLSYGALVLDQTRQNLGTDIVFLMDPDGVRVALMRGAPRAPASDA